MIDARLLRDNPDQVRESIARRRVNVDFEGLLSLESRRRELIVQVEQLRAKQNEASKQIATTSPQDRDKPIAEVRSVADSMRLIDAELVRVQADFDAALAQVPNLVHPQTPPGKGEESNEVLREVGEPPAIEGADNHLKIGEALGIIDVRSASKVSGSRFAFLKGAGVLLEFGLVRYALDHLMRSSFTPVIPPVLVREQSLFGTGFLPTDEAQIYKTDRDDLYLAGTSEVSLAGLHTGEVVAYEGLPLRYAGFSTCFRREAGTYGRETKGLIRVHQFDKLEMFSFADPSRSQEEHEFLLQMQEEIFAGLEIPYRVVDICAGDLGASAQRKFDIEAWLPGENRWLEVTSCSNCTDYQARRLGIRARHDGNTAHVHTLNGTAVAVGRTIVAILENHQRPRGPAGGSVRMPQALHPYLPFTELSI